MSVERLLGDLLAERRAIAERVVHRVREEIPSFAGVPVDEQIAGVEAALELIVRARLEGPQPRFEREADLLRELGERRARQGVPVDDLLRAWRIGIDEATGRARELAERSDATPAELFDLLQDAFGLTDEAMVSIAGGHRHAPEQATPEDGRQALVAEGALLGRLSPEELHSGFVALDLDPLVPYRAFRARHTAEADAARVARLLSPNGSAAPRTGVAAVIESEIAGFSREPLERGEVPLVAVGPPVLAAELPSSYRAAGRVLAAAETFGLAGVHDLASAGLHASVIEDPELGDALVERLVTPVGAAQGGAELLATVGEWLAAGRKVDPAAARLHVHANTVRYRLARYEELTGADLSETEDTFRVWWALQRARAGGPDDAVE